MTGTRGRLTDCTNVRYITKHAHVMIIHPRHSYHTSTGTIVRIDYDKKKVWVALSGGDTIVPAGHRSVMVLR